MIAPDLLPHDVLWQQPVLTPDAYGNDQPTWSAGQTVRAWVQQDATLEMTMGGQSAMATSTAAGRATVQSDWLLVCNTDGIESGDRITWRGLLFEVNGLPELAYTPAGFHHAEVRLRRVTG